jgi:hypothetical protein
MLTPPYISENTPRALRGGLTGLLSALYYHRNYGPVLDQLWVRQAVLTLPDLP